MADMKFHCPHCEQTLIIDEQYAGQICECPDCKRELCIPLPKNKSIVLSCQINTWQEILDVLKQIQHKEIEQLCLVNSTISFLSCSRIDDYYVVRFYTVDSCLSTLSKNVNLKKTSEIFSYFHSNLTIDKKTVRWTNINDQENFLLYFQSIVAEAELLTRKSITRNTKTLSEELSTLKKEIAILQKNYKKLSLDIEYSDIGLYKPSFTYETSLEFSRAIDENIKKQKQISAISILSKSRSFYSEKDRKNIAKLMQKSFNNECDLCMEIVNYKNIINIENRITRSFEFVNELGKPFGIAISKDMLKLKIEAVRLIFELSEKKHQEKQEQQKLKEIMRDELKAEQDYTRKQEQLAKEQERYEKLLNEVIASVQNKHGKELEALNIKIDILKQNIDDIQHQQRALSQAQLTKSGFVYVISNIGSLGENIYKIGMTRRLDPQERIDELSGASVPFEYDVHAIIYRENAPELESELHRMFDHARVNKLNKRKEFFNVKLEEIEKAAQSLGANVIFTKLADAKEYRQSLVIKN